NPDNDQWTITSFAAGATCTITITTTVANALDDGVVLLNSADTADDAADTSSAGAVSIVQQCAGQTDGTTCDDRDACTTNDACSGQLCVGGAPPNCDDGNACTSDRCDANTGCANTAVLDGTSCDDGNPDTVNDSCHGGMCAGSTRTPTDTPTDT